MILGRISTICSLVYINKKAIFEANERMKAVLFEKLIIGEIRDYKELLRELKLLNIYVQESYHIAYVSFNYKEKSNSDNSACWGTWGLLGLGREFRTCILRSSSS